MPLVDDAIKFLFLAELEKVVSDYSKRTSALEETVNDLLKRSEQNGHSSSRTRTGTTCQPDVDSGLISLLSEDEESDNFDHSVLADALLSGRVAHRDQDRERRRSLHQLSPRRERSRSRSPLRQDESEGSSISRRNRERSPSESTTRIRRRPQWLSPLTPSSPSTSSHSSSATCGNSDSSVVQSTGRRNRPAIIEDSSSVGSPTVEARQSTPEYDFDGIPEYAVFFSPPGSTEALSIFGDRRVHQWLQSAMESPSGISSDSSSSSTTSC